MSTANGRGLVAGIDLGGTNMQIGIVDADSVILGTTRCKTEARGGREMVIDRMVQGIREACRKVDLSVDDLAAVGVAAPGAIDMPRGVVIEAPNLGWHDVPLEQIFRERLDLPIVVDNDVNAAAWGEYRLGAGRGCEDLLGVWVGTGVGGGLVLGGRLYHGARFTAGEIGHTVIEPSGPAGLRTVEDLCSRSGLRRVIEDRLTRHRGSCLEGGLRDMDQLVRAIEAQDALALEVVRRSALLLGIAIANWVTVLALGRVLVGGGVTEALGEGYLRDVRQSFEAEVFPQRHRACELRMTELRDNAGLLGAALLAREAAG